MSLLLAHWILGQVWYLIVSIPDLYPFLTLIDFNNSFFCLFIFLCLNKQNVKKCFIIKFYIPRSENLNTFHNTTLE